MKLEDEIIAEGMVAVGGSVGVEVLGEHGTKEVFSTLLGISITQMGMHLNIR